MSAGAGGPIRPCAMSVEQLQDELVRLKNELASAQRELDRRTHELTRLSEDKTRVLRMLAHDIRNPLGVIAGFTDELERVLGAGVAPEARTFLDRIHGASRFITGMLDDYLVLSRIEAGEAELLMEDVDPGRLVEDVVAMSRVLADPKRIRLEVRAVGPSPLVRGDRVRLQQVLSNLLSNAIKFSPADTTTEVSVGREGDAAVVCVRDHGPGIAQEEQAKLFQPFSRASVRSTGGEPSTGLGLAIARSIVEAHHGRIELESRLGEGSSFRVRLPAIASAKI